MLRLWKLLPVFFIFLLSSCSKFIEQKGHNLQIFDIEKVNVGQDTKKTILQRFGEPSTISILNNKPERWYYTQRVLEESVVGGKKTVLHKTLQLSFNKNGVLEKSEFIVGENAIPIFSQTTKEKGYDTNFLKETFRNVGKLGHSGGLRK